MNHSIDEVWIVASPKSGTGAGRHEIDALVTRLNGSGHHCRLTQNIGELAARIADPGRSNDGLVIVAAGGDGTIGLVAQNAPPEIPLVPMPMGTENLLARHGGYSSLAVDVEATLRAGKRFKMDAGLANGKMFLVMVTAGMDAEVVRGMHLTRRGHINRWSYTRPILRAIARYRYPLITSTEQNNSQSDSQTETPDEVSACWMMAFNLPCYAGGLNVEPDAIGDDGLLDLISLRKGFLWSGLNYLVRIQLGRHLRHPDVIRRKIRRARWTSPTRVPYQIDGDYAGRLPVEIEVLPERITLLRPVRAAE